MVIDLFKMFLPAVGAFAIGIAITPILTAFLYRHRVWKKSGGKIALDGTHAVEFGKLRGEVETKTPRMGGIVIWMSVAIVTFGLWFLAQLFPTDITQKLDYLSRNQTWLPLFTLLAGALIGLLNDILDITYRSGERGIPLPVRLGFVIVLS